IGQDHIGFDLIGQLVDMVQGIDQIRSNKRIFGSQYAITAVVVVGRENRRSRYGRSDHRPSSRSPTAVFSFGGQIGNRTGQIHLKKVVGLVVDAGSQRIPVVITSLDDPFLVEGTPSYVEGGLLIAPRYVEGIIEHGGR